MGDGFDPILLFGRLHPLVLHFPIAFLLAGAAVEAYRAYRPADWLAQTGLLLLGLGAVSAVFAASMGFTLSIVDGHEGSTLAWHRALGILVAITAVAAFLLRLFPIPRPQVQRALYPGALVGCVVAIFGAGHFGGMLTHGPEFLDEALPRFGGEAHAAAALGADHFDAEIQPILAQHCLSCHGDTKQRGGLRLDTRVAALAGGESGSPAITPGSIAESEFVRRLFLPRDDDKAMPPDGRERPTPEQIVTLLDWVQSGAPYEGGALAPAPRTEDRLAEAAGAPTSAALAALAAAGARAAPLSQANPLLDVELPSTAALDALSPARAHVAWLKVREGALDADSARAIASLPRLTRLDLTGVNGLDGSALGQLARAPALETLVLTGTDAEAAGVRRLSNAKHLRAVYLFGTGVSEDDAEALRKRLKRARVFATANLAEPTGEPVTADVVLADPATTEAAKSEPTKTEPASQKAGTAKADADAEKK